MQAQPSSYLTRNLIKKRWFLILLGFLVFSLLTYAGQFITGGIDWDLTFRPAALGLLSGISPYENIDVKGPFAGAPWALLPLIPFALLPEQIGRGLIFAMSGIAFSIAAIRLGARPLALGAFLLSPPVLHSLINANLDWMPLVGFSLPPQIGLFFLAVKPQMGSVVALYWLVEAWRKGKFTEVLRVFGPISVALLISIIFFNFWPINTIKVTEFARGFNASLWPSTLPVGIALAVTAIRKRKIAYSIAASPCLSPYVLFHSWSGALIAVIGSIPETIAAVIGLWLLVIYRALSGGL